jgi:DNA repair protein RecO (recombination protein O)
MTRPRSYQTPVIVIKKTKLGEADRILTLYTPELGKIQGVAKATRRPRSKLSGHLELLTYSHITLARGKNIDTIIGAQTINPFLSVKSDLDRVSCALYMLELVNQFTPDETPDPKLFELLVNTLERLSSDAERKLLLRYFELHLLKQAGYRPELEKCVLCRKPLEGASTFSPSAGGALCTACVRQGQHYGFTLSASGLRLMRLIQTSDWESLSTAIIDATFLQEIERLMRSYIRYLLEKDVKSAAWLDRLEQEADGLV